VAAAAVLAHLTALLPQAGLKVPALAVKGIVMLDISTFDSIPASASYSGRINISLLPRLLINRL
jgi:hypothetical protein